MRARGIALAVITLLPGASLPDGPPRRPVSRPVTGDARQAVRTSLAAIQWMARQSSRTGFAAPGSIDDLVHRQAVLAGLQTVVRQGTGAVASTRRAGIYHAPVTGRVVIGFGEMSDAGIRSRGLTFAVDPGVRVVAPAGGVVRYAQVFRGYGGTVIVDHGAGWTSLLTGLGTLVVTPGSGVRGGAVLGTAGRHGSPRITLELRRRGRPMNAAAMIG